MALTKVDKTVIESVNVSDLDTTGTASATTFLRGDNAWASASAGLNSVKVYTGADTWTKATREAALGVTLKTVVVEVQGAGGGGGGGTAGSEGAGGAAGAYSKKLIDVSSVTSAAIAVGTAGGGGSSSGPTSGAAGGASSWDDTSGGGSSTVSAAGAQEAEEVRVAPVGQAQHLAVI